MGQISFLANPTPAEEGPAFNFIIPEITINHIIFLRRAIRAQFDLGGDLRSPGASPKQASRAVE
jgi:hypothetical protein